MIVFEDILKNVGGSGKYQYIQCIPLVLVLPLMSWHLLGGAFLFALPQKRCTLTNIIPNKCSSTLNSGLPENANVAIQPGFSSGDYDEIMRYLFISDYSEKKLANCFYKSFDESISWDAVCEDIKSFESKTLFITADDGSVTLNSTLEMKLNNFTENISYETKGCTAWSYSNEYYQVTGLTEFDWVCDRANLQQLMQIAVMVGVFWGSPLFGWTSDTYGRKPTMVGCITMCLGSMGVLRFSSQIWHFFVLRMLDGAGAIGAIAAAFVLISEVFESVGYQKILVLQIAQALFGVSQAILAGIASKVRTWQSLSVVMASPCLMVVAVYFVNNESARWLISQNRYKEANSILRKTAKINGRKVEESYVGQDEKYSENDGKDGAKKENFLKAMKKRPLQLTILNLAYQWFMLSGLYYTLAIKAVEFGENPFLNFSISGLLEAPACFGTLLMFQFLGRRPSTFYMEVIAGISLVALLLVPESYKTVFSIFPQIGKFALSAAYGGIYIYSAEIFPTTIKNFGIGVCSSIARIAGVISQFIEMIPNSNFCKENENIDCKKIPYVIYGAMTIVGCLLMFFLPETNGHSSPETIDQGNQFGKGQQGLMAQIVTCNKTALPTKSLDEEHEYESLHKPLGSSSINDDENENDPERETHL